MAPNPLFTAFNKNLYSCNVFSHRRFSQTITRAPRRLIPNMIYKTRERTDLDLILAIHFTH